MAFTNMPVRAPRVSARVVRVAPCSAEKGERTERVIAATTALTAVAPAAQAADVDSAVDATVQGVQTAGELLKGAFEGAKGAAKIAGEVYEQYSPQIKSAVDQAAPVVKQGVDEVSKVAAPAIKSAVPVVTKTTSDLLTSTGVDVKAVTSTTDAAVSSASGAISKATPVINSAVNFLTTTPPEDLGKAGLALLGAYFLLPVFVKSLFGSLRGFAGELSPAKAVDIVSQQDDCILIDLRSLKEKSAVGVPDVPSSARGRFVELESAEIERRLRNQLRDATSVETQITALEICSLKRVNKGSTIILLDKSGNASKTVAKDLCKMGFRNVYTVIGGFSGWTASKLQIRPPVPGAKASPGPLANIIGTVGIARGNGSATTKRKTVSS